MFLVHGNFVSALTTADYAVMVTATRTGPTQVTLTWPAPTAAPGFYRVRRQTDGKGPGDILATIDGSATSYVDNSAPLDVTPEYRIETDISNRYGMALVGFDRPAVDNRVTVLLIVDQTMSAALSSELSRLENDLWGDGWKVLRHDVPRDDAFASSGTLQQQVKTLILNDYNADPTGVKQVILFGHVPVPYSGATAPDGHSNHMGAWPADVYYGDMAGVWTDATVTYIQSGNARLTNLPGDGKFDQSNTPLPGPTLGVGRIDLSNMPAFGSTETDLLRNYHNKDHDYRQHQDLFTLVPKKNLIRDEFGVFSKETFTTNN
jgi:hypothetical protein